jgi:hypothetical protein
MDFINTLEPMKKSFVLGIIILCSAMPQISLADYRICSDTLKIEQDTLPFPDFKTMLDTVLSPIGSSLASTGILIERNFSYLDLSTYSGNGNASCSPATLTAVLKYLNNAAFVSQDAKYNPDTLKSRVRQAKDSGGMPIIILDRAYNTFKTNVFSDSLIYKSNGKVYWDSAKATPCDEKRVFMAAPFKTEYYSNPISFIVNKSNFVLSDRPDSTMNIFVDFGDGNGYINVPYDTKQTISYPDSTDYVISVKVCTASDTLLSKSKIRVHTMGANPTYNDVWEIILDKRIHTGTLDKTFGDARVWYGCGHTSIKKPFLFVEGYDPDNQFSAQDIYDMMSANYWIVSPFDFEFRSLPCELKRLGYDVIILNFGEGGDWLENNMEVFKQCLRDIWNKSDGSSDITVVGASMGGVIARYGLAEMEHNNEAHHCKLFAAFDSPFRGAEVPLGLEEMVRFFSDKSGWITTAIDDQVRLMDLPAARELLKYYIAPYGNLVAPYPDRTSFLSSESGLPYPSQCRNIALVEGSLSGDGQRDQSSQLWPAGNKLFHGAFSGTFGWTADIWSIPHNPSSSGPMADFKYWNAWGWITWLFGAGIIYEHFPVDYGTGLLPIDNAPGGFLDFVSQAAIQGTAQGAWDWTDIYNIKFHCFVPTYSALDLDDGFLNSNILTLNPTTPFSAYYGNTYNSLHILWSPGSIVLQQFLTNELMAYDLFLQNQTLVEKKYEATNSIVAGSNVVPASHQAPTVPGASWQTGPVVVPTGGDVTLQAGNNIQLRDGFLVASGSLFHAFIAPVYGCASDACQIPVSSSKRSEQKPKISTPILASITLVINPNPSNTFLNVQLKSDVDLPNYTMQVFDILGNELHSLNVSNSPVNQTELTRKIDVTSLPSGSYLLRVIFGNGKVSAKPFIIKR